MGSICLGQPTPPHWKGRNMILKREGFFSLWYVVWGTSQIDMMGELVRNEESQISPRKENLGVGTYTKFEKYFCYLPHVGLDYSALQCAWGRNGPAWWHPRASTTLIQEGPDVEGQGKKPGIDSRVPQGTPRATAMLWNTHCPPLLFLLRTKRSSQFHHVWWNKLYSGLLE